MIFFLVLYTTLALAPLIAQVYENQALLQLFQTRSQPVVLNNSHPIIEMMAFYKQETENIIKLAKANAFKLKALWIEQIPGIYYTDLIDIFQIGALKTGLSLQSVADLTTQNSVSLVFKQIVDKIGYTSTTREQSDQIQLCGFQCLQIQSMRRRMVIKSNLIKKIILQGSLQGELQPHLMKTMQDFELGLARISTLKYQERQIRRTKINQKHLQSLIVKYLANSLINKNREKFQLICYSYEICTLPNSTLHLRLLDFSKRSYHTLLFNTVRGYSIHNNQNQQFCIQTQCLTVMRADSLNRSLLGKYQGSSPKKLTASKEFSLFQFNFSLKQGRIRLTHGVDEFELILTANQNEQELVEMVGESGNFYSVVSFSSLKSNIRVDFIVSKQEVKVRIKVKEALANRQIKLHVISKFIKFFKDSHGWKQTQLHVPKQVIFQSYILGRLDKTLFGIVTQVPRRAYVQGMRMSVVVASQAKLEDYLLDIIFDKTYLLTTRLKREQPMVITINSGENITMSQCNKPNQQIQKQRQLVNLDKFKTVYQITPEGILARFQNLQNQESELQFLQTVSVEVLPLSLTFNKIILACQIKELGLAGLMSYQNYVDSYKGKADKKRSDGYKILFEPYQIRTFMIKISKDKKCESIFQLPPEYNKEEGKNNLREQTRAELSRKGIYGYMINRIKVLQTI